MQIYKYFQYDMILTLNINLTDYKSIPSRIKKHHYLMAKEI